MPGPKSSARAVSWKFQANDKILRRNYLLMNLGLGLCLLLSGLSGNETSEILRWKVFGDCPN
jgi:hypothetical protein